MSPSPLQAAGQEAARKLASLQFHRIAGNYANKSDADALRADLEAVCTIIDPLILSIGEYAQENFGFSAKQLKSHFTDQLRGALEGNATFVLDEAGEEAMAALYDNECSDFHEHSTLHRSAQG